MAILQLMNDPAATSTDLHKLWGITFGALNIRSLTRRIDDVELFLHRSNLDYLMFNYTIQ